MPNTNTYRQQPTPSSDLDILLAFPRTISTVHALCRGDLAAPAARGTDRSGEAIGSWNLGLEFEKSGETARAVALMQVRVDYERGIGHSDAEKAAARVDALRRKLAEEPKKP